MILSFDTLHKFHADKMLCEYDSLEDRYVIAEQVARSHETVLLSTDSELTHLHHM